MPGGADGTTETRAGAPAMRPPPSHRPGAHNRPLGDPRAELHDREGLKIRRPPVNKRVAKTAVSLSLVVAIACSLGLGLTSAAQAYVYWTSAPGMVNTIGRANLDGSGANESFITGGGGSGSVVGLAV